MPLAVNNDGEMNISETGSNGLPKRYSNLRSEAIDEILSRRSGFLNRWSLVIFLIIFLVLLSSAWFVQYPDIVTAKAKLTSINAAKTIISKIEGKLVKLKIKEGETVKAGTIIGFMESTSDYNEVLELSEKIDSMSTLFSQNKTLLLPKFIFKPYKNLGELQQPYQTFLQSFITFKSYSISGFFQKKKLILKSDLSDIKQLNHHLNEQKVSQEQDVGLAQKTFEMNEILKKEKVISELEYRNEKSKLLMKQLVIPQINEAIVSNATQQNEKRKEIMELENTIGEQRDILQQALHTFKSMIDEWKKKYVLIAPISGKISFATFLQENQQLSTNQTVCFINSGNSEYFAETFIRQENFGKVKKGEKVLLKFSSYPSQEYGSVIGILDFISTIPSDSGFIAKITLPYGLITNYKKEVQYREGLTANAEIITRNTRLIERFYYNLRKEVQR